MSASLVIGILGLCLAALGIAGILRAYLRFRGKRLVTCPANDSPAVVELAAWQVALAALIRRPVFKLRDCSRWSARSQCGQECSRQIAAAPEECLITTILSKWYLGKVCTYCGNPVGQINWGQHKPGLASPEMRILRWQELLPETIPGVLKTHSPVCWNCYVAETHTL